MNIVFPSLLFWFVHSIVISSSAHILRSIFLSLCTFLFFFHFVLTSRLCHSISIPILFILCRYEISRFSFLLFFHHFSSHLTSMLFAVCSVYYLMSHPPYISIHTFQQFIVKLSISRSLCVYVCALN